MSSPAKRRKTNKGVATKQPVRSLDFFFGNKQNVGDNVQSTMLSEPSSSAPTAQSEGVEDGALTDEQLARKLQDEWNGELNHVDTPRTESQEKESVSHEPVETEVQADKLATYGSVSDQENHHEQGQSDVPLTEHVASTDRKHTLSLQTATAVEDEVTPTIPFDQSPLTFDPSKYVPALQKVWTANGGSATYALLTHCFVLVNSTQSRIKIVDNLVNMLRVIIEGDPDSLLPAVWLATNSISPPYIDLELGLGGSAISKALKKVCGLDGAGLKKLYDKHGDAGDVAFEAKKRQSLTLRKPKPLSIPGVFEALVKIANSKGTGSVEFKQKIVERLVQDARGAEESRYIVRTLVQHLRIGAVKTTMLIALARAFTLSRPFGASFVVKDTKELSTLKKDGLAEVWSKSEEVVKACFARRPNYNDLVPTLVEVGVCDELLIRCGLAMHIPLRPMLGNITRDLGEMLTKLQGRNFSCEFKYDGQRAQVHCDEHGKVTIFSRHLEVMTEKYPDLVALVPKIRGESVRSFILEGEVVAIDRESSELKTFQTLANRARKDVVIGSVKIDVCLFAFDLMYLNGEELLDRPFRERRELLRSLFTEIPNYFTWVKSIDATSNDEATVLEFFKSATDVKCEGLMVKVLDNLPDPDLLQQMEGHAREEGQPAPPTPSRPRKGTKAKKGEPKAEADESKEKGARRKPLIATYEPDKRSDSWLKVKKDYNTTAETLDLIPVAGWHGQGRKAKWWSPILLAVRNPESGCLEAVTKCISGFTDKFYQANKEKYEEGGDRVIERPTWIEYGGSPDVWFEPQEVWEMVAFADITLSPTYTAAIGLVSEERGLSLRFPRFLKVREDKSIEEATTSDYLATIWRKQEAKTAPEMGVAKGAAADDEDFD
ncbi:MAG: hypothetical protein M1828_004778 [Chrysothrix sp. TS-e1954]|nr:MAG: hypothetical protein M1828_004778 [Chrysothrix sp. TS-e1954]